MVPGPYNNNYQIVQTGDRVAIEIEMIHDVRIIPLDGRKHLSSNVRLWMGDSVGHWEGDTLVVDTTNFTDKTHFRGSDQNLHVVERFTRTDADTIQYRFTIDDPTAFTKPWTGEIAMSGRQGRSMSMLAMRATTRSHHAGRSSGGGEGRGRGSAKEGEVTGRCCHS